jgi:hypothetical protein
MLNRVYRHCLWITAKPRSITFFIQSNTITGDLVTTTILNAPFPFPPSLEFLGLESGKDVRFSVKNNFSEWEIVCW